MSSITSLLLTTLVFNLNFYGQPGCGAVVSVLIAPFEVCTIQLFFPLGILCLWGGCPSFLIILWKEMYKVNNVLTLWVFKLKHAYCVGKCVRTIVQNHPLVTTFWIQMTLSAWNNIFCHKREFKTVFFQLNAVFFINFKNHLFIFFKKQRRLIKFLC